MDATILPIVPLSVGCNTGISLERPNEADLANQARGVLERAVEYVMAEGTDCSFFDKEKGLKVRLAEIGRLLIMLFLCVREREVLAKTPAMVRLNDKIFDRRPAQARNLSTVFGVVRYWRTYLRGPKTGGIRQGYHPLDAEVGLFAERISPLLASLSARLATMLSFAQTASTLSLFLGRSPSTEVIERSVLGLGRHTYAYQEQAPAPPGDGDVLVIQIDGKAAPTATDEELSRRRGKRRVSPQPKSARHRGRHDRQRHGPKRRRRKGDKSKNGKVATVVVMYTLKRTGKNLCGPMNREVFASFRPKRAAFDLARSEAEKRGFGPASGKRVQLITDGDEDLAVYRAEYLPHAEHTIDVMHVVEYIWKAGRVLYREGSPALVDWVDAQKKFLYEGESGTIIEELDRQIENLRPTPGVKSRRLRLEKVRAYLSKRQPNLNYGELQDDDMDIGSGSVEGAVNHVVGKRFDQGGMRWIKGRAEALLQLRCIEINGRWDAFTEYVHTTLKASALTEGIRPRLLSNASIELVPDLEAA